MKTNTFKIMMAASALLIGTSTTVAACEIPTRQDASHEKSVRLFHTVVVAVHGWKGGCNWTFGKGDENFLTKLRDRGSFDIDCFQYNSREGTAAEARQCLDKRLKQLKKRGYREFAFVTHSTGGVIALDTITRKGLEFVNNPNADHSLFDVDKDLKLKGLYAWASPINGTGIVGTVGNWTFRSWGKFWKRHEKMLPDLKKDSKYLADLKNHLKLYDNLIETSSNGAQLTFDLMFLQGNGKDWIVADISGEENWWPKKLNAKLASTETSHSGNIGAEDVDEAPKLPLLLQKQALTLNFNLYPRFSPYFDEDAGIDANTQNRRVQLAQGIANYISNPSVFVGARTEVSNFLSRLFVGGYRRDPDNDEKIVELIMPVVKNWFSNSPRQVALESSIIFLEQLKNTLNAQLPSGVDRFGGGSLRATNLLVCSIKGIFLDVADRSSAIQQASWNANERDLLKKFDTQILSFISSLFPRLQPQSRAFGCSQELFLYASKNAETEAIAESGMIEQLELFSRFRRGLLTYVYKKPLAETFLALARRPELTAEVFTSLNKRVKLRNDPKAPLWAVYLNDEQMVRLTKNTPTSVFDAAPVQQVVEEAIERIVSNGNNTSASLEIVDVWVAAAQAEIKLDATATVKRAIDAARRSSFAQSQVPLIQNRFKSLIDQ